MLFDPVPTRKNGTDPYVLLMRLLQEKRLSAHVRVSRDGRRACYAGESDSDDRLAPGRLFCTKFYNRLYGIRISGMLVAAAIILVRICGLFDLQAEILRIDSEEGGYMSLIEIRNLNKYYRIGKNSFHVLKDINLHVERGDFISIEGKSGAGKSTLLNLLGCIDTFDSGEYCLDGKQIERLSEAKLAAVRNTKIGYVFQDLSLIHI